MELTDRELALRWWNRKSIQEKTELAKQAKFPVENRDFKTFCGLAMAAKEKLIINRDVSGGYCKTAVSRWHGLFSKNFKLKYKLKKSAHYLKKTQTTWAK